MKRILCISGSRADYGLLEWPVKVLRENFDVTFVQMEPPLSSAGAAFQSNHLIELHKPDCLLILGDRWEILQAAIAAHLQRVPIAHIGGGDVTRGSYDDAMRDCISRLATWHFTTSDQSRFNVRWLLPGHGAGADVHMIGNIALDYIMHGDWKREKPCDFDYVVVSYQPETIDNTVDLASVWDAIGERAPIWITPNNDRGSERIPLGITLAHDEYLNLIWHADELIGNSSSMLYEAPALGVKCRMIGRRQEGRVAPTGDGRASERIKEILCRVL